jgi:hypothetical protein
MDQSQASRVTWIVEQVAAGLLSGVWMRAFGLVSARSRLSGASSD